MTRWLLTITLISLCFGQDSEQIQASNAPLVQQGNLLMLVDLQGALFSGKAPGSKTASIHNSTIASTIRDAKQQNAKVLYIAQHPSEIMFWKNSIKANHLPIEDSFSLSNEIFHGFEGSMPSCRTGIVLCQGHPFGEILGMVINQLWIRTQFSPNKIVFYTASKERGKIVADIGSRTGAQVEIKLVDSGFTSKEPSPEVSVKTDIPSKKQSTAIPLSQKPLPEKSKKTRVRVSFAENSKKAKEKTDPSPQTPDKIEKTFPVIKIDESRLEKEKTDPSPQTPDKIEKTFPVIKIDESKLETV